MPFPSAGLTVSGAGVLDFQNFSSSGGQVLSLAQMNVSGMSSMTLNVTSTSKARIDNMVLGGDLTLTHAGSLSVGSISEDSEPRRLIKAGSGVAELNGVGSHSGGTEVHAGKLIVLHSNALGSGLLTLGGVSGTASSEVEISAPPALANNLRVRSGSSGAATLAFPYGGITWHGNIELQKTLTLKNGSPYSLASVTGLISGSGGISKTGSGELIFTNSNNSFGSGTADAVSVVFGRVTVASDGALGNPANGVTLTGVEGTLKVDGTFQTSRKLTFTGTATGVEVTGDHVFTVQAPFAGTGTFLKTGTGTIIVSPGVDNSARGSARTQVDGGTLRIHGPTGLSNGGAIAFNENGILELLSGPNTSFAHPIEFGRSALIHVDRGPGSTATGGRHTLGNVSTISGSLLVTGANGYGLTLGGFTTSASNSYLTNNAPGVLNLSSLTGNPGSSFGNMYVRGSGDIRISGAVSEGAGSGSYTLVKDGSGTLRLGTAISDFPTLYAREGTLDLNGLTYTVSQLWVGGGALAQGARIDTGTTGRLSLTGNATFLSSGFNGPPPGSVITGNLHLGSGPHTVEVPNSLAAAVELTVDGTISGVAGGSLLKSGNGVLRMTGPGNTHPGLTSVSDGLLELAKTAGDAVGNGGLTITGGIVRLLGAAQIHNSAVVNLNSSNDAVLDLNGFAETVGSISLTQSDATDYTAVRTGADGTLVLNGSLTLINNGNSSSADGREVLITGSGSKSTPASDGILDLGGVNRTIQVSTTTSGINATKANSTIETRIINGGIVKTGPRTLQLTNPGNTFAGGLQIAQGMVRTGGGTSLGLGAITFTNAAGVLAGIDLGSQTGSLSQDFTLGGTGDATFTHSADSPGVLVLRGNFNLNQNLLFEVVNGTIDPAKSAVLEVTGLINDGPGTFGLTKLGNGTLRLAAGNTYSGPTTVKKGILSIASDSALGDSTATLSIDGGCLHSAGSFDLARNLTFGPAGGSVRNDGLLLELSGSVAWGVGDAGFFGSGGTTVLSGATSGTGGKLLLGWPTSFAPLPDSGAIVFGHTLSLRGAAALPAGSLLIDNLCVLELGNGDFTRSLGSGPGQLHLETTSGAGWAAHGAERFVNLGGKGDTLVWGQTSPPFLSITHSGFTTYGSLVLGSSTGTHTVDFQNPVELDNGTASVSRKILVNDGPAAVDARISGGIRQSADPNATATTLAIEGGGTLQISGGVTGAIHLEKRGAGTAILSGANTLSGDRAVYGGTLQIAGDASWGAARSISIGQEATLDVSAMTSPVGSAPDGSVKLHGTLVGDVATESILEGNGLLAGDLHALAASRVHPELNGQLHVSGDFTLDAAATVEFRVNGPMPQTQHTRMKVDGSLLLAGGLEISRGVALAENDSFVLILNDGDDPIGGVFAGLPEGAGLPIGNGLAFQVTYLANGDGGAVGNDFGVTVVVDTFSTDLALTVDAPLAVDFGSTFTINYTVENFGPATSTGSTLAIPLPVNAVLVGSTPAGTVNAGTLTIPVPALTASSNTTITVQFTAPGNETAILVEPLLTANGIDGFLFDNQAPSVTAVMAGGCLILSTFDMDQVNDEITLGIDTITGVNYVLQRSIGLDVWSDDSFFGGDGEIQEFVLPMIEPREFFRFSIVPYGLGGGGE
jgi:autotransporter-associated beta strand protein